MPGASHRSVREMSVEEGAIRFLACSSEFEEPGCVLVEAGLVHRLRDVSPVPPPAEVVGVPGGDERAGVGGCDDRAVPPGGVPHHQDAGPIDLPGEVAEALGRAGEPSLDPRIPERFGFPNEPKVPAVPHVIPNLVHGRKVPTGGEEKPDLRVPVRAGFEVPLHHTVRGPVRDLPSFESTVLGVDVRSLEPLESVFAANRTGVRWVGEEFEKIAPLVVHQRRHRLVDERRVLVHRLGDLEGVVGEQSDRASRGRPKSEDAGDQVVIRVDVVPDGEGEPMPRPDRVRKMPAAVR